MCPKPIFKVLFCSVAIYILLSAPVGAGQALFDFEGNFDIAKVQARDVKITLARSDGGSALNIKSGHNEDWPGITLTCLSGKWDLSKYEYLLLDVKNVGVNSVNVSCRVDNPGSDGSVKCIYGNITLQPGKSGTVEIPTGRHFTPFQKVKLFGMRGYPAFAQTTQQFDPTNVNQLLIFVPKSSDDHAFEIDNIRTEGDLPIPKKVAVKKSPLPFLDTFGQYIHKDWPGKIHSAQDITINRGKEKNDLEKFPGPASWNKYGGYQAGPQLKSTGFFRPEKYQGKWWLVDPQGRLFFSHGIDCVNWHRSTPIDDREKWFQDFPGAQERFKPFLSQAGHIIRDYYQGKRPRCFNFYGANLLRKYGPEWQDTFAQLAHRRLRSWGLNTIGNWSDSRVYLLKKTPYVVAISFGSKLIEGSTGYWGKFKDPFDPDFAARLRSRMAREKDRTAGDPWCIGYFVDNEIAWGSEKELALASLKSPPDQAAKKAFIAHLKQKYGAISKLNTAWRTDHASWQALLEHQGTPDEKAAADDLLAFSRQIAHEYFSTIRYIVKEIAPNQLYLGCRFAWSNRQAVLVGAEYCDVVSYNFYRRSVADFRLPEGLDKPVIIGEFHFGALDRGMFHTGLVPVKNQAARAEAYQNYVRGAMTNPAIVGCHWFQYSDQSTIGRALDGENYQIGFLDICDTPYPETIAACRDVGARMYQLRLSNQLAE